ncbi:MAG: ZIP family metal transporter [Cyclobacteriaceae bacterium]|nr:ZIP family metal transporter [Cyclobacteriaceae bacterium]
MIINLFILIGSALLGGFLSVKYANKKEVNYSLILAFSGAYLFSITIIHLLPELFSSSPNAGLSGLYVLAGFFLQQILEYFTAGAEHGHVHPTDQHHSHKSGLGISLLIGLSVHALLEGSLLTQAESNPAHTHNLAVALGIGLHKLPAAFAMMTILLCYYKTKAKPILFLILFTLASPVGLFLSQYAINTQVFTQNTIDILFALVSGSFLYISTTIVFESTPGHQIKLTKLLVLLLGAGVAVLAEMVM